MGASLGTSSSGSCSSAWKQTGQPAPDDHASRQRHAPSVLRARAQVISEYRKARALMADVAAQTKEGVWHNLFLEVEKARQRPSLLRWVLARRAPLFA